jgi:hypothetical protein
MERVTSATQPIIRLFHFPPFPPVPEGVKIIPFKDFREHGTRVVGEDKIERDGLGIPTIALMNKDKKKKAKSMNATMNGSLKKEWWENWEASGESVLVRGPYDPYVFLVVLTRLNCLPRLQNPQSRRSLSSSNHRVRKVYVPTLTQFAGSWISQVPPHAPLSTSCAALGCGMYPSFAGFIQRGPDRIVVQSLCWCRRTGYSKGRCRRRRSLG